MYCPASPQEDRGLIVGVETSVEGLPHVVDRTAAEPKTVSCSPSLVAQAAGGVPARFALHRPSHAVPTVLRPVECRQLTC